MLIEKTLRKLKRFDLNSEEDMALYNALLANPAIKIISREVMEEKDSHFEQDYSETKTHHIAYLEIEECSL